MFEYILCNRTKELRTERKWVSKKTYCDWAQNKELDLGEKVSYYPTDEFKDKEILY